MTQKKTPINQRFPFIYGPRLSVEDVIKYILPWAEFRVDDDDKYDYLESIWSAECYCGYDKEDNTIYYTQSFDEWCNSEELHQCAKIMSIYEDGEVEMYRLYLELNEIGKAFLLLDDFLQDDTPFLLSS